MTWRLFSAIAELLLYYIRTCTISRTRPANTLPSPANKNGNKTSPTILSADSWSAAVSRSSSGISGRVSLVGHGAPVEPPGETASSSCVDRPSYVAAAVTASRDRSSTGGETWRPESLAVEGPPSNAPDGTRSAPEAVGADDVSTTAEQTRDRYAPSSSNDELSTPFRPAALPSTLSDPASPSLRPVCFQSPSVGARAVLEGAETVSVCSAPRDSPPTVAAASSNFSIFPTDSSFAASHRNSYLATFYVNTAMVISAYNWRPYYRQRVRGHRISSSLLEMCGSGISEPNRIPILRKTIPRMSPHSGQ